LNSGKLWIRIRFEISCVFN